MVFWALQVELIDSQLGILLEHISTFISKVLNLGIIDIWVRLFFVLEDGLCIIECWALLDVPLDASSTHQPPNWDIGKCPLEDERNSS